MCLPPRYQVLGVRVSSTDYAEVCELVISAAKERKGFLVAHAPVHLIAAASREPVFSSVVDAFDIVTPDGQPVRWALRLLHGVGLSDRVYGPFTMLRLCLRAEQERIPIYLYGSTAPVLDKLQGNLQRRFPEMKIVGSESPPFRQLTDDEDVEVVKRINDSGAGVVFVGLGCPKQEKFAFEHRENIRVPQVCVGAAFDFIAGTKKMAPETMQKLGFEWLFRLLSEPSRLWQRYLYTNTYFVLGLMRELILRPRTRTPESKT